MQDETFRPRRPQNPNIEEHDQNEAIPESVLNQMENMKKMASMDQKESLPQQPQIPSEGGAGNFKIEGTHIPPAFLEAMKRAKNPEGVQPKKNFGHTATHEEEQIQKIRPKFQNEAITSTNSHAKEILEGFRGTVNQYEELELPSKGRFYDGTDGPIDGILSIRQMTGEEEQILATQRYIQQGQAVNMIFKQCIKENYRPEKLLSIDRTYLLIYLRCISYTPNYEIQIRCPECEKKISTTIGLHSLWVEPCPDDYGPSLQDVLPTTNLPFSYRLSTGRDENEIKEYRERKSKFSNNDGSDDTLTYRTAMLLNHIDGVSNKSELLLLLKNMPINDLVYIRNCINEPPFGVDTNIEVTCSSCFQDFEAELPLEANFFFPKKKKVRTQA